MSSKRRCGEQTSKKIGTLASYLLRSKSTPMQIRRVAASALTQRPNRSKKK